MTLKFHSTCSMHFKTDTQKGVAQENLKAELPLPLPVFTKKLKLLAEVKIPLYKRALRCVRHNTLHKHKHFTSPYYKT